MSRQNLSGQDLLGAENQIIGIRGVGRSALDRDMAEERGDDDGSDPFIFWNADLVRVVFDEW